MRHALAALFLTTALLPAQINIAFHNGTATVNAMTTRPDGTVVATSSNTWNNPYNTSGQGLEFTNYPLLDNSGNATGATLAASSGYSGFNSNGWGVGSQDHVMMEGWYGFRAAESVVVSKLPASFADGYSVIIYGDSNNPSRTMNYTVGDGTTSVTKTIQDSGLFSGTFTEGAHVATFQGFTGTTLTISGNPGSGDPRSAINGLVILPGNLPTLPEITSFTADDHYVTPGTSVTLDWQVTGADTIRIDQGVGDVTGSTSAAVTVGTTTTYTLTATNADGSTTTHNSPTNWISGGLPESHPTLPALLQQAGYRTIHAGKAHFGATAYAKEPRNIGFDVNIAGSEIGHPGSYTGNYGQGGSRPVPGLEEYHNTGTFLTEALTLEINKALEDAVNDSNAPLRHKKGSQYEGGVREPLIVAWAQPDAANSFQTGLPIPADSREDDIVAVFDLFPTFAAVAETTFGHAVDGHDLSPYLRADPGTHRPQELLIHFPHDHRTDYFTIFREGDWKLIYEYASNSHELYNLANDISESNDRSASEPERVMTMARKMARQLDEAGAQWPTFASGGADDPFAAPVLPAVDVDHDGLPDNTEDSNFNGLVDPGETSPDSDDTDGDATNDAAELKTGTDPLDPGSFFRILNLKENDTGRVLLTWPSAPGALYRVESSTTLSGWSLVQDNVPADPTDPTTTFDAGLVPLAPTVFFRAVLK